MALTLRYDRVLGLACFGCLAVAHAVAALWLLPMTNREKDVEVLALRHPLTVYRSESRLRSSSELRRVSMRTSIVIVSLLYKVARTLLSVPAVLLHRDSAKDAELLVLRHGNAVLRRQIPGRVRYEPADRFWFAAPSAVIPRRRWPRVFPVTPATLLDWHRRFIAASFARHLS